MARDHRAAVESGLALKKAGNRIVELIGGRAIHPVSVRVGGFSRTFRRERDPRPPRTRRRGPRDRPADRGARRRARDAVVRAGRAARRPAPPARVPDERGPDRLDRRAGPRPLPTGAASSPSSRCRGRTRSRRAAATDARTCSGRRPGSRSPRDQLHPLAAAALAATGLAGRDRRQPVSRHRGAGDRARRRHRRGARHHRRLRAAARGPRPNGSPVPRRAAWATEAPRGLIFHAYELDERGHVAHAQIVPPTSQNQAAIEADLAAFAPSVLGLPHAEATLRIEQLIRSYDPCISCATHFLDLHVEDVS